MSDDEGPAVSRRSLREQRQAGGTAHPSARANRSRRAADAPLDALPGRTPPPRARDRGAPGAERGLVAASAPLPGEDPAPLTRRQLRLQSLSAAHAAAANETGGTAATKSPDAPAEDTAAAQRRETEMSVEAALAARRESSGKQATGPVLPADPTAGDAGWVDPELLARQREHAAGAAAINRRVEERERLEQANSQRIEPVRADPFTGAMNQLRDPQAEKALANTGIRGPQTRGFLLELAPPAPKPTSAGASLRPTQAQTPEPEPVGTGTGRDPASGAAATPVRAVKAQGLDPLDYLTAGVRRANRLALVVLGSLVLGGVALVTGLILIVNSR